MQFCKIEIDLKLNLKTQKNWNRFEIEFEDAALKIWNWFEIKLKDAALKKLK